MPFIGVGVFLFSLCCLTWICADDHDGVADSYLVNPDPQSLDFDPLDKDVDMRFRGDETMRNAIRSKKAKWPGGVVPYKINNLGTRERSALAAAVADYKKYTCIRWEPYDSSKHGRYSDYVEFIRGSGCYSYVGRSTDRYRQPISLGNGCGVKGIAIHEMMHAIGFFHEQSRGDRDSFVRINYANIPSKYHDQFEKLTRRREDNLGSKYDYNSVMHYGRRAFAARSNLDTVVPLKGNPEIGQRKGFSSVDIWKINQLYGCPDYFKQEAAKQTTERQTTPTSTTTTTTTATTTTITTTTTAETTTTPKLTTTTRKPITTTLTSIKTSTRAPLTTQPETTERKLTTTERQETEAPCVDAVTYPIRYCKAKQFWGWCKKSEAIRTVSCRKTCGTCSSTPHKVQSECVDTMDTCYMKYNCVQYAEECRKSCGKCSPPTTTTTTTQRPQAQQRKGWWG